MIKKNDKISTLDDSDVARYFELKEKIDELTAEKERLGALIKNNLDTGNYKAEFEGDTYSIALVESMTSAFARADFEADFPRADFPDMYELVPSSEKIKIVLGDDRKEYYGSTVRLTVKKLS